MKWNLDNLKSWVNEHRGREDHQTATQQFIERDELIGQPTSADGLTSLERWRRDGLEKLVAHEKDEQAVERGYDSRIRSAEELTPPPPSQELAPSPLGDFGRDGHAGDDD